jgi:hypothetical protein
MAEVLCVYRQVKIIRETAVASKKKPSDAVAIVSYDAIDEFNRHPVVHTWSYKLDNAA